MRFPVRLRRPLRPRGAASSRSWRRAVVVVALLSSSPVLPSCTAFETNVQDGAVEEKDTARQNFEAAEAAFAAERWQEAVKYFELVKNKFPYSKYAVLAELRLADAHFAREKWLEAASAYRLFVRFHPRHEQVAYAAWRVAESHSRAIEDNVTWLPFVEAREKDQSAAVDTIKACDDFLLRFPKDEHADDIRALRVAARGRLAEVDLYAAAFYEDRGKWQGARWRYERVVRDYAETPRAGFALWRVGQIALQRFDDAEAARIAWGRLLREHADAPEAAEARAALERLATTHPPRPSPLPPAPADAGPPDASPPDDPTTAGPATAPPADPSDDGATPDGEPSGDAP
jgi:outer membrane protein assembly factor BamD